MRKVVWWQYGLMGAGWALAAAAWRMRCVDLNGFLSWQWDLDTNEFVRFLFERPHFMAQDFRDPRMVLVRPSALHAAWLGVVLLGFVLFVLAPVMVRRQNLWRAPGQRFIRVLSLVLLAFPLTIVAPADWHLPRPLAGMYLLAAGHVLVYAALALTPAREGEEAGFPVEGKG